MAQEQKKEEIKDGEVEDFDGDLDDGISNDKGDDKGEDGGWYDDTENEKLDLELELGSRGKGGYSDFDEQM